MCNHMLEIMGAKCMKCGLVLNVDQLLDYAEKGMKSAQQGMHKDAGNDTVLTALKYVVDNVQSAEEFVIVSLTVEEYQIIRDLVAKLAESQPAPRL